MTGGSLRLSMNRSHRCGSSWNDDSERCLLLMCLCICVYVWKQHSAKMAWCWRQGLDTGKLGESLVVTYR